MGNIAYIKEMSYVYFGGVNYIFRLSEAIEDLFLIEEGGYMAIRGMSDDWIEESLEELLEKLSMGIDNYKFEGSISEWPQNRLYIIALTKNNMYHMRKYFDTNKKYYFCAEWISYFKENEVLVDIGHAFDGAKEQMHVNHKIPKDKISTLEKRRGICIEWSG